MDRVTQKTHFVSLKTIKMSLIKRHFNKNSQNENLFLRKVIFILPKQIDTSNENLIYLDTFKL